MLNNSLELTRVHLCAYIRTTASHAKALFLLVSAESTIRRKKSSSFTVFIIRLEWVSSEKVTTSNLICINFSLMYKINLLYSCVFLTTNKWGVSQRGGGRWGCSVYLAWILTEIFEIVGRRLRRGGCMPPGKMEVSRLRKSCFWTTVL